MAQTIKLKRSGTSGAIPTTSQLELGEVAINTYDGKMYIKKNVGGTESIVEIGSGATSADAIFEEYIYTATSGQTSFSGSDDNSLTLSYTSGAVQVFLNGVLLDPDTDYTATNGTTVVLASGAAASDLLQIFAFKKKIGDGQTTVDTFTGNNSTTAFTLSLDPGDENNTRVYIDGVYQSKSNYSVSGTTLTFSTAPPTGTAIEVEIGNRVVTLDTLSDLDLPDNVKLRIGTSQDLEIFHNGTDSVVNQTGTGDLLIQKDETTVAEFDVDGLTVTGDVEADEFIGDIRGAVLFKAQAGETLAKGDVVYISGISGTTTVVSKADADDANKMPAFGIAAAAASTNNPVDIYTNGILSGIDTSSYSEGDELFVSTTAGALTSTPPAGASAALQKIGKVTRSHASAGSIFVIGAGRTNAVPNLNDGDIFIGNGSNQATTASLNTKIESYLDGGTSTPQFSTVNSGNITTTGEIRGPATFVIDPAAVGDNTGTVQIKGNLQVDGTQTTINSTTLTVDDLNITLASGAANATAANGAGITIDGASATLTYASSGDTWDFNKSIIIPEKVVHAGDTDTFFQFAGANDIRIVAGNVEHAAFDGTIVFNQSGADMDLRVESTGNENMLFVDSGNNRVGIGTNAPTRTLNIDAGSSLSGSIGIDGAATGNQQIAFAQDGTEKAYLTYWDSSDTLALTDGSASGLHFSPSTGRVGIGTNAPATTLNLKHTGVTGFRIETDGDDDANFIHFKTSSSSSQGYIGNESSTAGANFTGTTARAFVVGSTSSGTNTQFISAGTVKATLTSGGNFGIGTSSPSTALTVSGGFNATTAGSKPSITGAGIYGGGIGFIDTNVSGIYTDTSGANLKFFTNQSSSDTAASKVAMTINGSGQVGIGNSSPNYKLDITAAGNGINITGTGAYLRWNAGDIQIKNEGSYKMGFYTYNSSDTTLNRHMVIDTDGNVGIGTDSPAGNLDVQENTTGQLLARVWNPNTSGTGTSVLRVANSGNNAQGTRIEFTDQSYYVGSISSDRTNGIQFGVNATGNTGVATERWRIDTGGLLTGPRRATTGAVIGENISWNGSNWSNIDTSYGAAFLQIGDSGTLYFRKTSAGSGSQSAGYVLSINSSGNMGIGYSNSTQKLFVAGGVFSGLPLTSLGSPGSYMMNATALDYYDNGSRLWSWGSSTARGTFKFIQLENDGQNQQTALEIDSEGRVGIGVTPNGSNHLDDVILQFPSNYAIGGAYSSFGETASGQSTIIGNNIRAEVGANNQVVRHNSGSDAGNFLKLTYNQGFTIHTGITSTLGTGVDHTINERLRVDTSGNVGIGTASPGEKLHVEGSVLIDAFNMGDEEGIFFREGFSSTNKYNVSIMAKDHNGSSADGLSINGYDGISFCTGSNNRNEVMRIVGGAGSDVGYVGIGTDSPSCKLNILAGNGTANGNVAFKIGGPSNYQSLEMGIGPDTYAGFIRSFGNDLHYYSGHWRTVGSTASENHQHYWYTSKSGSSNWSDAKMKLDENGDLFVGHGVNKARLKTDGTNTYLDAIPGSGGVHFRTGGAIERANINSTGTFTHNNNGQIHALREHFSQSNSSLTTVDMSKTTGTLPFRGFNDLGTINLRGFATYVDFKTNYTADNLMFMFRFEGYLYNRGNSIFVGGGYTYGSPANSVIAKDVGSANAITGPAYVYDLYRASDGALCVKIANAASGYDEGKVNVSIFSFGSLPTMRIVSARVTNSTTNYY